MKPDTPVELAYDAHHQLVGLRVPASTGVHWWAPSGRLGFQGAKATRHPPHMRIECTATIATLLIGETATGLDAIWKHVRTLGGRALGQALVEGDALALVVPDTAADALDHLRQRWQRGDLAVMPAMGDQPSTWAIASRVRPQRRAALLNQQRAQARLAKAAVRTGVIAHLIATGCAFSQIEPVWDDPVNEKGLAFRLVPTDLRQHQAGTYRAADLRAWAQGRGPVMTDPALLAEQARHEGIVANLHHRLTHAHVAILRLRPTWIGQGAHRTLGYHLVPAPGHEAALPEGAYPLKALQNRFPLPPPAPSPLAALRQRLRQGTP